MMTEKSGERLSISIIGEQKGILIGRSVVFKLGLPNYICILKGEDKQSIAIAPCSDKHVLSFKVPDGFTTVRNKKFRIYSQSFVEELLIANKFDQSKTHRVYGKYSDELDAVIFPLLVL